MVSHFCVSQLVGWPVGDISAVAHAWLFLSVRALVQLGTTCWLVCLLFRGTLGEAALV